MGNLIDRYDHLIIDTLNSPISAIDVDLAQAGCTLVIANPMVDQNVPATPAFQLMDLPVELRSIIYRELLVPRKPDKWSRICYSFSSAILRVSKRVHEEASDILYKENFWIKFQVNDNILDDLTKILPASEDPDGYRLLPIGPSGFPRTPALSVNITHLTRPQGLFQSTYVDLLDDLPRVCRHMTTSGVASNIAISLCLPKSMYKKDLRQSEILNCFRDARGIGNATVQGFTKSSSGHELSNLMMTPIHDFQNIIDRVSEYQAFAAEGIHQNQKSCFISAMRKIVEAVDYYEWIMSKVCMMFQPGSYIQEAEILWKKMADLSFAYSSCSVKVGDFRGIRAWAISFLGPGLPGGRQVPSDEEVVQVYYYLAMALVLEKKENAAAYSFLQILQRRPGFEDVENQLDAMEIRLKHVSPNADIIRARGNLRHVLSQYRYKPLGNMQVGPTTASAHGFVSSDIEQACLDTCEKNGWNLFIDPHEPVPVDHREGSV